MRPLQQRQDPMRVLRSRLVAVGILLVTIVILRGVWGVYEKQQGAYALRAEAEAQLADLEKREAQLREDIALLRTDRGLEEELRERFDLAREGEGTVVIVDPPQPEPITQPEKFTAKVRKWFPW